LLKEILDKLYPSALGGYHVGVIYINEIIFRLKTISKYGTMVLKRGLVTNDCKKTLKSVQIVL